MCMYVCMYVCITGIQSMQGGIATAMYEITLKKTQKD